MNPRHSACAAGIALVASLLASGVARPACPANSVSLGGYGSTATSAQQFDSSSTYGGAFHGAYNLATGELVLDQCCNLSSTVVDVVDAYDVTGVPAGTPVLLTAQLSVAGSLQTPGGVITCAIQHGVDVQQSLHVVNAYQGWQPFSEFLQLPVTIVAGQPEPIEFVLSGRRTVGSRIDASGSQARASIGFTGLPAGATIVSCQGYSGAPVPARRPSWGRLKTIYR
jgi:hypothetical protein